MLQERIESLKKQNAVQVEVKAAYTDAKKVTMEDDNKSEGDGQTMESSRAAHREYLNEFGSNPGSAEKKKEGEEEDLDDLISQVPTEMIS